MKKQASKTTMEAAMTEAGINANKLSFQMSLARYLNNGGTTAEVRIMCDEIDRQPGEANRVPPQGQTPNASARLTKRDDEAAPGLPQGPTKCASSSQPNEGDEANKSELEGQGARASSPSDYHEAGRVLRKRRLDLYKPVHEATVKAIFKVDGTDIRKLTVGRVRTLSHTGKMHSYLFGVLAGELSHLPDTTVIGDVKNDADLEGLVRQAEAYANA